VGTKSSFTGQICPRPMPSFLSPSPEAGGIPCWGVPSPSPFPMVPSMVPSSQIVRLRLNQRIVRWRSPIGLADLGAGEWRGEPSLPRKGEIPRPWVMQLYHNSSWKGSNCLQLARVGMHVRARCSAASS
jgi:hypothetical protein